MDKEERRKEKRNKERADELRKRHYGKAIRCWELEKLEERGY